MLAVWVAEPLWKKMLLEEFGGANGELVAAMRQAINCEDMGLQRLLKPMKKSAAARAEGWTECY